MKQLALNFASQALPTLDALDRYSLETRRPDTVPLVRELLEARDSGVRG